MTLLRHLYHAPMLHTPTIQQVVQHLNTVCSHRAVPVVLLSLGLLRAVISLLAYPAAHGADSFAYLFYAERLSGLELPGLAQLVPPLYSVLILITYKWLGSLYWLVAVQVLMSAALAPLYYWALKRFQPVLAVISALVILLDFQTATVFNFVSTEPLYVFLLALTFYVFIRQAEQSERIWLKGDALAGLLTLLLMLTRAVSRFLIIPQVALFTLWTRSWKRGLVMMSGFLVGLLLYSLLSQALLGGIEGTNSSSYMAVGVVTRNSSWLQPENGPASMEFIALQTACQDQNLRLYDCYYARHGNWDGMTTLIINAVLETIAANWQPYIQNVWRLTNDFLSLSGQQLGIDPDLPSTVQCQDAQRTIASLTPERAQQISRDWRLDFGMRGYIESEFEDFRMRYSRMLLAFCPPLPASPAAKSVVDYLMFRYRSLGRPQPYLYYGGLILLVLLLPWTRRYRLVLWSAGGILLYHALVSAVIGNVQPRYVLVTNPLRAILLSLLAVILFQLVGLVLNYIIYLLKFNLNK